MATGMLTRSYTTDDNISRHVKLLWSEDKASIIGIEIPDANHQQVLKIDIQDGPYGSYLVFTPTSDDGVVRASLGMKKHVLKHFYDWLGKLPDAETSVCDGKDVFDWSESDGTTTICHTTRKNSYISQTLTVYVHVDTKILRSEIIFNYFADAVQKMINLDKVKRNVCGIRVVGLTPW